MRSYGGWKELLDGRPLPAALVDLDALEHNLGVLLGALREGLTLRLASKSLRVPELMKHLTAAGNGRVRGLMTYSAHETAKLAELGFDDLLLGYPISRADEAAALTKAAAKATLRVVVDDLQQARLLSAAAEGAGVTFRLCLDVDVSLRPFGGAAHLGVRRSPVRSGRDAAALARAVSTLPGLKFDSVLAYEAQVAGLPDTHGPGLGEAVTGLVKRLVKQRSIPLAASRRREVVSALREAGFAVELVNGGGSGSVWSTSADPSVTEVTAGSGFVDSHLFDGYRDLPWKPAVFFALAVCRRSDPGFVTCAGGGYVASGSAGPSRLPIVHAPEGLKPIDMEGFGEVQTPLTVPPGLARPEIGDPVICRHAKAGELAERFPHYLLVRGQRILGTAPTYRGLGLHTL